MSIKRLGFILWIYLCLAGCASTNGTHSADAHAEPPADKFENIHTLLQHIHLNYGNHNKVRHWNTIDQTPYGEMSSQSVKVGPPMRSGIQLDALIAAQERSGNTRDRYSDKSRAREKEALYDEARAAKRAPYNGVLQPQADMPSEAHEVAQELGAIKKEIDTYCREHKGGNLALIFLNERKDDPDITRPLPVSVDTRGSQIRFMCIPADENSSQAPFIVDLNHKQKPNRRLEVRYTAITLDATTTQKMLDELAEIIEQP